MDGSADGCALPWVGAAPAFGVATVSPAGAVASGWAMALEGSGMAVLNGCTPSCGAAVELGTACTPISESGKGGEETPHVPPGGIASVCPSHSALAKGLLSVAINAGEGLAAVTGGLAALSGEAV